jgi:uncharacterized membrane protein YfcA
LDVRDWLTFICSALGLLLAAGGGIGGGGILVPVLILVGQFSPKEAVPLTNICILGGSISNCAFNMMKRHPFFDKPPPPDYTVIDRPRIDYDIVLVMEPMTIAGAVLGSLINKILPGYVLTILLFVVLGAMSIKTFISGRKKWVKETADKERDDAVVEKFKQDHGGVAPTPAELSVAIADRVTEDQKKAAAEKEATESSFLVQNGVQMQDYGLSGGDALEDPNKHAKEIEDMREEEKYTPFMKLGILLFCWVGVNVLDLMRGGGGFHGPFDIYCGDAGYWLFTFLYIPFTVAIASIVAVGLIKDTAHKEEIGYPWVEGDVHWTLKRSIIYPLLCSTAGLFAGMFGVGGGIVKGPLMTEMGVLPEVTSATAAFMIFFTASAATVSFTLYGMIIWSYAAVFFFMGILFTAFGQVAVQWAVDKLGRPSIIVFVITAILGSSVVLLAYNGFDSFAKIEECGCSEDLRVCK